MTDEEQRRARESILASEGLALSTAPPQVSHTRIYPDKASEPVAWRWRYHRDQELGRWIYNDAKPDFDPAKALMEIEPLYALPASPTGPFAWALTWPDGEVSFTRREPKGVSELDLLVTPLHAAPQPVPPAQRQPEPTDAQIAAGLEWALAWMTQHGVDGLSPFKDYPPVKETIAGMYRAMAFPSTMLGTPESK